MSQWHVAQSKLLLFSFNFCAPVVHLLFAWHVQWSSCWPLGLSLEQILTLGYKVSLCVHPVSVRKPSTTSHSPGTLQVEITMKEVKWKCWQQPFLSSGLQRVFLQKQVESQQRLWDLELSQHVVEKPEGECSAVTAVNYLHFNRWKGPYLHFWG